MKRINIKLSTIKQIVFQGAALLFGGFLITSCEDPIDVTLEEGATVLVVDAWLNNQIDAEQTIKLTLSQPYFENAFASGALGADVQVISSAGDTLRFTEQEQGIFTWQPEPGKNIGDINTDFTLLIEWDGNTYSSITTLNPVPPVDSISQEFRTDEIGGPDGIYTQFFARDLPGLGNTYWIKTFKNGEFLNKPQELNIAFDGAFDPGAQLDSTIFITPIREASNRVPDEDNEADDSDVAPWETGDEILVEIHSISNEAFFFLETARDQMTNGDNTIFALPLANARGNVLNMNGGENPLGIFNVAAVSSLSRMIE